MQHAMKDVLPGIVFLATRVEKPNQEVWMKFTRLLNYLKKTEQDIVNMEANDNQIIIFCYIQEHEKPH